MMLRKSTHPQPALAPPRRISDRRARVSEIGWFIAIGVVLFAGAAGRADEQIDDPPPTFPMQAEVRSGGVLEESYHYHREAAMQAEINAPSPQPSPIGRGSRGWYGYGFPVSTYRWGWFGAEHYYPFVWWHEGYYGDCCRYAYRCGY
jgi:hypothetical protein